MSDRDDDDVFYVIERSEKDQDNWFVDQRIHETANVKEALSMLRAEWADTYEFRVFKVERQLLKW